MEYKLKNYDTVAFIIIIRVELELIILKVLYSWNALHKMYSVTITFLVVVNVMSIALEDVYHSAPTGLALGWGCV